MHTVRNRLASRPPIPVPPAATPKVPNTVAARHDLAYIQRGSMAVPLTALDGSGLVEPRQSKRRNPKGKKARKAAARLAAAREAQALVVALPDMPEPPPPARPVPGKGKAKVKARAKPKSKVKARSPAAAARKAVRPQQLPAIPAPPLLEQRLAAALPLPSLPEPLVVAAPAEPVRLLSFDAMPELREEAFVLPAVPEPLAVPAEPEPETVPEPEPAVARADQAVLLLEPAAGPAAAPEPATALAALADVPVPRARALVPARRQGLVDVIAFLLRDSGRRLARWSARRHKTREEQATLRRAEARQINLQRELEALDALRRHKG